MLGRRSFGRMSTQAIELLPALAREWSRGLHPRLRRRTALGLLHRLSGIVSIGLQRAVAHIVARDTGADLPRTQLEPLVCLADLATSKTAVEELVLKSQIVFKERNTNDHWADCRIQKTKLAIKLPIVLNCLLNCLLPPLSDNSSLLGPSGSGVDGSYWPRCGQRGASSSEHSGLPQNTLH